MDLLAGMSRDELRIYAWVAAAVFALVAGRLASAQASLDFVGLRAALRALNAGAGIYVLNHSVIRAGPRSEPPLSAPSFSGTPWWCNFWAPWTPP